MFNLCGTIIVSSPALDDPNFRDTEVFITEHNNKGCVGFVINRLFSRKFNELEEFKDCPPLPLYVGGPVDQEHIYFLHKRPDLIADGILVNDGIYLGGNFKQAVLHLKATTLSPEEIKLFIGYAGWDNGELEAEIEEGSWTASGRTALSVFDSKSVEGG